MARASIAAAFPPRRAAVVHERAGLPRGAHRRAEELRAHFALHEQKARERGRAVVAPPPDEDDDRGAHRRGVLGQPAPRRDLRPEDLARVPRRRTRRRTRCCSSGRCRSYPAALVKVAPAVERPGIHLGVCPGEDGLSVWGTVRAIPFLCFVVEVAAPGLLVVKHHRGDETGKFVNVAVIEGDQIKIVDEAASSLPDCPPLLTSLLGFDSPASWTVGLDAVNVLVQLAVSMRAHGRGGLLLVVPPGSDAVAGVDRAADPVRGVAGLRRARAAHPRGRGREGGAAVAGRGAPRGGSDRRADGGRRRHGPDQRSTSCSPSARRSRGARAHRRWSR